MDSLANYYSLLKEKRPYTRPQTTYYSLFKECFASIIALSLHLHLGICEGFTGVLMKQLQAADSAMPASDEEVSWIASLLRLSMIPGALFAGVFMEIRGRKPALQLAFLLCIAGWTAIASADTIIRIYVGRVLTGFAIGMESALVVYISEVSTPRCRAVMMAVTVPTILFGSLVSYLIGYVLPWKWEAFVIIITSASSFVAIFFIPESPIWLFTRGNTAAALKSLKWLRAAGDLGDTNAEFASLQLQATDKTRENVSYFRKIMATKAWKPFLILELFFILQELTGSTLMIYYSPDIYQKLGTPIDELVSAMGYAGMCLLSSVSFLFIVNRVDRKTLCFWSAVGVCLSYSTITAYTFFFEGVQDKPLSWLPMVGTWISGAIGYMGIYSLTWQMAGELFPNQVRGFMSGLLFMSAYLWMFTCVKLYPTIVSTITVRGILVMLAVSAAVDAVFGKFVLPETRGKTLAEIEQFW